MNACRGDRKLSPDLLALREKEALQLVVEGKSNREIADLLFISPRTVENHRAKIIVPGRKPGPSFFQDNKPTLLDQLRESLHARHYSRRSELTYCSWLERFIPFNDARHPAEVAEAEINAFLTNLPEREKVSASPKTKPYSIAYSIPSCFRP
jgi:hypothetical protein